MCSSNSSSAFWLSSRLYAGQKATACKLASVMQNEETTGWQEQQLPFAGSFADVSFIEPVAQRFLSSFKDEKEREIQRTKTAKRFRVSWNRMPVLSRIYS